MAKIKLAQDLLNALFPVGSVVIRADTIDPKTLYGGTWALFPDDYYLMSSTNDTPGSTMSGSTTTGSTAISTTQMPSHGHGRLRWGGASGTTASLNYDSAGSAYRWNWDKSGNDYDGFYVENTGGSQGHTHSISYLQMPALNLRVWRRTA